MNIISLVISFMLKLNEDVTLRFDKDQLFFLLHS